MNNDHAPTFTVSKYLTPLAAHTAAIKYHASRAAGDLITVGKHLTAVKDLLPHGEFGAWVDREFSWSARYAQTLMNVAKRFQDSALPADTATSISALTLLAAPSTPDSALSEAIGLLESGNKISIKQAQALIRKHRGDVTADAVDLLIATAPSGRVGAAISNGHLNAVNAVIETLVTTGAVHSVAGEEMHLLAKALEPAITQEEYESTQRQREYLKEKAMIDNDKIQLRDFSEARKNGLTLPRYELYALEVNENYAPLINPLGVYLTLSAAQRAYSQDEITFDLWKRVGLMWVKYDMKYEDEVAAIIVSNVHTLTNNTLTANNTQDDSG